MNPNSQRVIGFACCLLGLLTALLMIAQPEGLNVPLFVGLSACLVFVWAGAAILIRALSGSQLYNGVIGLLLLSMLAIPAWIALGSGPRTCIATGFLINKVVLGIGCRLAFGFGALLLAGVLAWVIRSIFRPSE